MGRVTAEQLSEMQKVPRERVTVPVFGAVTVRGMTGDQRDAFEASCIEGRGKKRDVNIKQLRAKLAVLCVYDEHDAERIFTEADIPLLSSGRADVLNVFYSVGARLSGMTEEDAENLGKALETETRSASSSSLSRVN
jgi:hypothetical protein